MFVVEWKKAHSWLAGEELRGAIPSRTELFSCLAVCCEIESKHDDDYDDYA